MLLACPALKASGACTGSMGLYQLVPHEKVLTPLSVALTFAAADKRQLFTT